MYTIDVTVQGVAPLLQHRYPMPEFETMGKGNRKQSGAIDYSQEWRTYFYATPEGDIYQPSSHFDGALVKAAGAFKVTGKRGATYKELFKASVFVAPEKIMFGMKIPEKLDTDGDKPLYIDLRPVVVQRARITRMRPAFAPGWKLSFEIQVIDDQINAETVQDILTYAGKAVGVGDNRPRFGRFTVTSFDVHK
jgi:hypothetical protein